MALIDATPFDEGGAGPVTLIPMAAYNSVVAKQVEGNEIVLPHHGWSVCYAHLHVDATASDANDKLDIYLDWKHDIDWINIVHFQQVLGTTGEKHYIASIPKGPSIAAAVLDVSADLAAGSARSLLLGEHIRARVTRVDGGSGLMSFTYHVKLSWKV